MKVRLPLLVAILLIFGLGAFAQQSPAPAPPAPPRPPDDPISRSLYPPELVMANQRAIGLEDEQKEYLRQEIREAQARFTDLQWELQDAMESLHSQLEREMVDEEQVLRELEKVLDIESRIKRTQIKLMVRIKNRLTVKQKLRLRELRRHPPEPPTPPRAPAPPTPPNL